MHLQDLPHTYLLAAAKGKHVGLGLFYPLELASIIHFGLPNTKLEVLSRARTPCATLT